MSNVFEQLLQVVTGEMEKVEIPVKDTPVDLQKQLRETIRAIVRDEYAKAFKLASGAKGPKAWEPTAVMRNSISGIRSVVENELYDIMKDFNARDTK